MPAKKKVTITKKQVISKKTKIARGPAASVSRRASSIAVAPAARRREPSSASPLSKKNTLTVPVYSLVGKTTTTLSLPKEVFGKAVNKGLLAQAMRVYTTNKKIFTGATKGRGQVEGSTVKIFRQKGTGRARHGSVRAPIFVGGGIVFGPTPRSVRLNMPSKMKKAALFSALSSKASDGNVLGLTGLEKATGKTKEISKLISTVLKSKSALIVIGQKADNVVRAVQNIDGVDVLPVSLANAYEVLMHDMLLITKEAVEAFTTPKEEKV